MWPGRTVYILGGGPSLNAVDVERLRGERVIACNHAYQKADWIDMMLFADYRFYFDYKESMAKFSGLRVTTNERHHDKPGMLVVRRRNSWKGRVGGIVRDPSFVIWNKSTGACAINFAVHLGASRIVLFGFDMRRVEVAPGDERCNWHETGPTAGNKNPYKRFLTVFPMIARDLKEFGIECINATPKSAIKEFKIVKPEEVYP